ncbi:MAG: 1-acyl-sn-glycerol-3-phosphate acyltransferase [Spirochaetaceae bacterium]|nr:1-acyl-sn-glycerol-3-phosphate acyltransferase [Spirochaetaceae bacterium]
MKSERDTPVYRMARWFFKKIVVKYFRVEYIGLDSVKRLEKPYIVLPNHCSFFDPFLINAPIDEKFHYVVSDSSFRNPITRWLLAQTGAIAITKNTTDLTSLKKMIEASRSGKVIGVFPEGLQNWDGATLPLIESTAKMVRMLNVPIVVPLIEGAYLMGPRWGTSFRRGRVFITYKILFDGIGPGEKKTSEIIQALKDALDHNEYKCERLKGIRFKGRKRAQNIEQLIYICPQCHSISSFRSKGNDFSCQSCGYSVHYSETGHFIVKSGRAYFDNSVEWNRWQQQEASTIVKKDPGNEPLFSDDNLIYSTPDQKGTFRKRGRGSLYFYRDKLEFKDKNSQLSVYRFDSISGMNVQLHEKLEFYCKKELHRFFTVKKRFSAKKVYDFYKLCTSL